MIEKKHIGAAVAIMGNALIIVGIFRASAPDIRKQLGGIATIMAGSTFAIVGTMMYHQSENLNIAKSKEGK